MDFFFCPLCAQFRPLYIFYSSVLIWAEIFRVFRSSDSTKYGTNKSSGASVTSGKHLKNQTTYGAHDSVSNGKPPTGKPPGKPPGVMHPNHHHNIHNHRTTTSIPVHNSNNRLINNTVFHNNQYTFSLNRYDDSGYLESTGPLSSASLYGGDGGQRISRGTKSDIGVPIRRPSASKAMQPNSRSNVHYNRNKPNNQLPSVKSDFLLSYLNNNHNDSSHSVNATSNNQSHHHQSDRCTLNNNSETNDCTNTSSAYHISGVSTSDFSDNYKTGAKYFYSNSNPSTNSNSNSISNLNSNHSRVEHTDRMDRSTNHSSHTINEQQRNRIINFVNRSHGSPSADASKNSISSASGSYENRQTSNVVGPLLYIDPTSESPSNSSNPIMTDTQIHSFKSVSK